MIRIRGPTDFSLIADDGVREFVRRRFFEICLDDPYDPYHHGELFLIEPGDTVATVERDAGCWLLTNPFDGSRYPDPDYTPAWEALETHACGVTECLFIANDEGAGVILFIPKHPDIDRSLQSLFAAFPKPSA